RVPLRDRVTHETREIALAMFAVEIDQARRTEPFAYHADRLFGLENLKCTEHRQARDAQWMALQPRVIGRIAAVHAGFFDGIQTLTLGRHLHLVARDEHIVSATHPALP